MKVDKTEFAVGVFLLLGLLAILVLALRIADNDFVSDGDSYVVYANFDNIGGLKVRSPVKVGGVVVGRVEAISLNPQTFEPKVTIRLYKKYGDFPANSSARILTSGLLGEQYISIRPGFNMPGEKPQDLHNGSSINDTKSAIILEDLIGQFLYSASSGKGK
ncbi:outer membrane lipid asymmetry maintenance protein MlaD [Celerinatantimonas diazotrophica]|uniref:Phospholipid/cholesterol/gamma-HCH transport system substrate-binding protein n=1 Tax=Celerinatantimonas diazotrophica TaxID=412034 RepID=A0A4V2PSN0_9GAMM|nr:outer membrane lipid asymmetry maintenance protein MlaD [Celerinatantimonas diazotrophica]TCK63231.1 phospholipid/cholesterol/gamma-HCH transport system substrate-binding protein [Celerinatantimonas diazotrophica]CAG9295600.1 Intermembrane phospholipid transport system binding protein MlaD [Celerinatantimonas diazotrophica]